MEVDLNSEMSALMSALEAIHANGSGFSEEVNWIYCNFTIN